MVVQAVMDGQPNFLSSLGDLFLKKFLIILDFRLEKLQQESILH